jgi:thymidylate kinase
MNTLICLFGVDGSGKSTLSNYLYEELKKREINVSYTWWFEGDNTLIRKFLRRFGKNFQSASNNSTLNKSLDMGENNKYFAKIFNNTFPWLVFVDYFKFTLLNLTIPMKLKSRKVMIFDRFYLDTVFAIYKEFNLSKSTFYRIISIYKMLAGTPDIIFFINVKPETALSRKKDEIKTLDNAKKVSKDYQFIYSLIKKMYPENVINIDGNNDLKTVKSKILTHSLKLLGD